MLLWEEFPSYSELLSATLKYEQMTDNSIKQAYY